MPNNTIIISSGASGEEPTPSVPNILNNAQAMAILQNAVSELLAIGVPCMLAPMSLPQGMTVSLHAGSGIESAVAANIAAETGGEYAGAAATHKAFMTKVEHALADPETVDLVRPAR